MNCKFYKLEYLYTIDGEDKSEYTSILVFTNREINILNKRAIELYILNRTTEWLTGIIFVDSYEVNPMITAQIEDRSGKLMVNLSKLKDMNVIFMLTNTAEYLLDIPDSKLELKDGQFINLKLTENEH